MEIKRKDLLVLAICTIITVFAWIFFEVYHVAATSTVTQVQEHLLRPLEARIDENTLNAIRE